MKSKLFFWAFCFILIGQLQAGQAVNNKDQEIVRLGKIIAVQDDMIEDLEKLVDLCGIKKIENVFILHRPINTMLDLICKDQEEELTLLKQRPLEVKINCIKKFFEKIKPGLNQVQPEIKGISGFAKEDYGIQVEKEKIFQSRLSSFINASATKYTTAIFGGAVAGIYLNNQFQKGRFNFIINPTISCAGAMFNKLFFKI